MPATLLAAPEDGAFDAEVNEASRSFDSGQFELSIVHYAAAYKLRPDPALLINMGRANHRLGRYQEALLLYARAESATDGKPDPVLWFYRAQTEQSLGQSAAAKVDYQRALREAPETPYRILIEGALADLARQEQRKLYRRPWFWAVIGTSVATAVAVSVGVGLATRPREPITDITF